MKIISCISCNGRQGNNISCNCEKQLGLARGVTWKGFGCGLGLYSGFKCIRSGLWSRDRAGYNFSFISILLIGKNYFKIQKIG